MKSRAIAERIVDALDAFEHGDAVTEQAASDEKSIIGMYQAAKREMGFCGASRQAKIDWVCMVLEEHLHGG